MIHEFTLTGLAYKCTIPAMNCSKKKHLVDYKRLAKSDEPLIVSLTAEDMPACRDSLVSDKPVEVTVSARHEFNEYFLKAEIKACLTMVCQRCMTYFQQVIVTSSEFIIVDNEFDDKIEQFTDFDPLVRADLSRVNLTDLAAEEVLLNIPAIPKHLEDSLCNQYVAELAI